ncbi:MAG: alpha/beta hydrolase, partial [Opitutaceae bacterium]|nr:alpha/beta hydrolase [Opitutaceae bacterium]
LDDQDRAFTSGVYAVFNPAFATGPRPGDAWGTVAAWAWGASRAVDYLKSEPALAALPVAVIGHSRGGKAALWCGAQDERVELTISNNSGSTGAALARGKRGESVALINGRFTHWFAGNYRRYDDAEDQLPVDQHLLIALAAPRLVYVASATEDAWADPAAEFRACVEASPVWSLFGQPGLLGGATQPPPDTPRPEGRIGYHLRTGDHALTLSDWEKYLDFARRHWPRP